MWQQSSGFLLKLRLDVPNCKLFECYSLFWSSGTLKIFRQDTVFRSFPPQLIGDPDAENCLRWIIQ